MGSEQISARVEVCTWGAHCWRKTRCWAGGSTEGNDSRGTCFLQGERTGG